MRRFILTLTLSVMLVTLSGCASLSDIFVSGTNAAFVLDQSDGNLILKADLNDSEIETVVEARSTIYELRDKFQHVTAVDLLVLHIDYYSAKDAYNSIYKIAVDHKDEYTADEWQAFTDSHKVAMMLDQSVNKYIVQQNAAQSSNNLISYLSTIAKLAVLL